MVADCKRAPSPLLLEGMAQFNRGDYFVCHETFEELWLAENGEVRRFYQGVLQIAAALHHVQRGNERGALSLLRSGPELLRPFAPVCQGVDVEGLLVEAESIRRGLETQGLAVTRAAKPRPRIRLRSPGQERGSPVR